MLVPKALEEAKVQVDKQLKLRAFKRFRENNHIKRLKFAKKYEKFEDWMRVRWGQNYELGSDGSWVDRSVKVKEWNYCQNLKLRLAH